MKTRPTLSVVIASVCLLSGSAALATIYTVPATANIFASGLSATVDPAAGGGGTLPIEISTGGGTAFQFAASGQVSQYYGFYWFGPDGWDGVSPNINSYGGISGYSGTLFMPLVGVFLTDATPTGPAPSTLDFTAGGLGQDFSTLSPQIGQEFFIGDGQTSGGSTQTFYAPAGATRLYLGFADAYNGAGDPGFYDDNEGSLSVSVTAVPEPTSGALFVMGAAMWAALPRRSKRRTQLSPPLSSAQSKTRCLHRASNRTPPARPFVRLHV